MRNRLIILIPVLYGILLFLTLLPTADLPKKEPLHQRFDPVTQSWAFVLPQVKPVPGAGLLAKDCKTCHAKIYNDWSQSTHAHALSDIQFQSELGKDSSPKWLCLNCHIPLQNQRFTIINDLEGGDIFKPVHQPNPGFDRELQQEAISCAVCHIRSDDSGSSYIVGPTGSGLAPHPVKSDKQALHNICERCHTPQGEALSANLTCWFDTNPEMTASQPLLEKKFGKKMHCVDCHMPAQKGRIANIPDSGLPERDLNRHFWPGGGIPKRYYGFDTILERGYRSGLKLSYTRPRSFDTNQLTLVVENENAGHDLPTGDPERFIEIKIRFKNGQDEIVYSDSRRIGQVWQWNPAKKVSDNRLKFGEKRKLLFAFPKSIRKMGPSMEIIATHVKVTRENMDYLVAGHTKTTNLYAKNAQEQVRHAPEYYPMAVYLYYNTIHTGSGLAVLDDQETLIHRSKMLRAKAAKQGSN